MKQVWSINTDENKEFKQWLDEDWFTSGETSWEEYFNDEAPHNG